MSQVVSVKISDHSDKVKVLLQMQIGDALEAVGLEAEKFAKLELETKPRRIDTGLLRNSITHAVSGKPAAVSTYSADKPKEDGKTETGHYFGKAPDDPVTKKAVYIGTNVKYAIYVHNGTRKMKANRFLKNAIVKNKDTLKAIFETYLKQAP